MLRYISDSFSYSEKESEIINPMNKRFSYFNYLITQIGPPSLCSLYIESIF